MRNISGLTLPQEQFDIITENVINEIIWSLVSIGLTSLAMLHIVMRKMIVFLGKFSQQKHSMDN